MSLSAMKARLAARPGMPASMSEATKEKPQETKEPHASRTPTLPTDLIRQVLWYCSLSTLALLHTTSSGSAWADLAKEDRLWVREKDRLRLEERKKKELSDSDADALIAVKPLFREIIDVHARFRTAMASAPPPTREQVINFVAYMASSHSWYKHLANGTPADVFDVFVSPVAGMRFEEGQYIDFVEGDGTKFHYTWQPTEKYRKRFGCLIFDFRPDKDPPTVRVRTVDGKYAALPQVLHEEGVPVTANVHTRAETYGLFDHAWASSASEEVVPSHFQSRMTRHAPDGNMSDLSFRARAHAKQTARAVNTLRRWVRTIGEVEDDVEDVEDGGSCSPMLQALEKGGDTLDETIAEMLGDDRRGYLTLPLARKIRAELQKMLARDDFMGEGWAAIALMIDRARQWAALAGAAQRAVRAVWGARAAEALGDVSEMCAFASFHGSRRY